MPILRPEIAALTSYEVGRPIEEVVRQYGVDPSQLVKLTANESPEGPFPGVADAVAEAVARANRYPDNQAWELGGRLAEEVGVDRSNLLFANGSTAHISDFAAALGGPGTSIVYAWPSFIMYRFAAAWAGSEAVEVPVDADFGIDLDALARAIGDRTRLVFLCNPNNPTGTLLGSDAVEEFIDSVPETVLIVVDEAYAEFVEEPDHRTVTELAVQRKNVISLRTFSKIYSLAGLRIGYAVGHPQTLTELRKAQQPLTVNRAAQAAALASLGQPEELARRVAANSSGRHHIVGAIAERGLRQAETHTNFGFFKMPGDDSKVFGEAFTRQGVLVRPMSAGWMRVTVGSADENRRFVEALDEVLEGVR
jgi:histidinol-phosphate aminotransferase